MAHHLVKRGLLESRKEPVAHVVAKFHTYKHPASNVRATVFLRPNVAQSAYWARTRYNLDERYDRIYCEDGDDAVPAQSFFGVLSRVLQAAVPMLPHKMTFNSAEGAAKYVVLNHSRDPVESRLAFESVKSMDSSETALVDPRARRLCEALNKFGEERAAAISDDSNNSSSSSSSSSNSNNATLNIALPWHMYHAPYICQRLAADGWTLESTSEEVLATRRFVTAFLMAISLSTVFLVYKILSWFGRLLFGTSYY